MIPGETAERIEMPLGTEVDVGPVAASMKVFCNPPQEGANGRGKFWPLQACSSTP